MSSSSEKGKSGGKKLSTNKFLKKWRGRRWSHQLPTKGLKGG